MAFVKEKNAPNIWTAEQREVLCVMHRWFCGQDEYGNSRDFTGREIHRLFCSYFAEEYHFSTNSKTISPGAVVLMFNKLQRQQAQVFVDIFSNTPFEDPEGKYRTVRLWIRRVSCLGHLEIYVREDEYKPKLIKQRSHRRNYANTPDDTTVTDPGDDARSSSPEDDTQDALYSITNKRQAKITRLSTIHRKYQREVLPRDPAYDHTGNDGNRIFPYKCDPYYRYSNLTEGAIAFRCWDDAPDAPESIQRIEQTARPMLSGMHGINSRNGFWAGTFNGKLTPPPSRNDQSRFGRSIFTHLRPLEQPSSWISVSVSLISSVHRLLKTKTAHLTFIDLDYVGKLTDHKFPTLYPATTVISQYRLKEIACPKGSRYHYGGNPEFIVWEHIPKEAILGSISYHEFMDHLIQNPMLRNVLSLDLLSEAESVAKYRKFPNASFPPNSQVAGETIGAFLSFVKVPGRFVKRTATIAALNWKFIDSKHGGKAEYFKGVEIGYNRNGTSLYRFGQHILPENSVAFEYYHVESDTSDEDEGSQVFEDDGSLSEDESVIFLHSKQSTERPKPLSKRRRDQTESDAFMKRRLTIKRTITSGALTTRTPLQSLNNSQTVPLNNGKEAITESSVPCITGKQPTKLDGHMIRGIGIGERYVGDRNGVSTTDGDSGRVGACDISSWVMVSSESDQDSLVEANEITMNPPEKSVESCSEATLEDDMTDMVLCDDDEEEEEEEEEYVVPSIEVEDHDGPRCQQNIDHGPLIRTSILSRRFRGILRPAFNC